MKPLQQLVVAFVLLLTVSCQSASPGEFFDQAVLNSNLIHDFEPRHFGKSLEQYTVVYPNHPENNPKGDEAQQVVNNKILSIEAALKKIKDLNAGDDDQKAIKENAIALFETALPVYKNEYMQYAKLCDAKSTSPGKEALLAKVEKDDLPKVDALMGSLYEKGKAYAEKHDINVKWGR